MALEFTTHITNAKPDQIVVTTYEPRWHGYARWEIELATHRGANTEIRQVLETGWIKRKRGTRAVETRSATQQWTDYYLGRT